MDTSEPEYPLLEISPLSMVSKSLPVPEPKASVMKISLQPSSTVQEFEEEPHTDKEDLVKEHGDQPMPLAISSSSPDKAVTPSIPSTVGDFKAFRTLLKEWWILWRYL